MTVINPKSISGITSITLPSGGDNVLTIHTNDGTERFRIDSSGNVKVGSACTISQDGDVFFTGVCTATTLAGSGANLTALPAANLTGALPAISGANLTGIAATDNVRTGILDVAGIATFRNDVNIGAAVTISESGIEASGIGITVANINGGAIGGRRNIIINGDMRVAQRGTSSTSTGHATVDRFALSTSSIDEDPTQAQVDVASGTTPYTLGFRKAYRITNGNQTGGANAGDRIVIYSDYEAQDLANCGWNYTSTSSFITFSFWVKSSVAQNFYFRLQTSDGTAQNYVMETGSLSADTWTKIEKTIPGNSNLQFDNDVNQGLAILWSMFRGTDTTGSMSLNTWAAYSSSTRTPDNTSTWYTTNDATFEITGVQLEVGSQATAFEHRSFNEELLLCKRYFNMIGDGALGAGTAMSDGFLWNNSGTELDFMYTFPVQMRTTPSIYQVTGGNYFKILGGGLNSTTYVDGNFNIQYASKIATSQYATMDTAGTVGRSCHITINNTLTKYGYSAEL